jgi:hypothetical protein
LAQTRIIISNACLSDSTSSSRYSSMLISNIRYLLIHHQLLQRLDAKISDAHDILGLIPRQHGIAALSCHL